MTILLMMKLINQNIKIVCTVQIVKNSQVLLNLLSEFSG
ncbi:hypothetical protein GM3708_1902 [Geminocystis sp. NIES-3708]|nr:hypothetical protein GM3708_1902 [Geminocystis sp. NIES-3708]